MAQCIEILRQAVTEYKSGRLDAGAFRDKVFDTLMESMDQPFTKAEVDIVLKLMEQMKSLGVADSAACDEVAEHFRAKAASGENVYESDDDIPTRRMDGGPQAGKGGRPGSAEEGGGASPAAPGPTPPGPHAPPAAAPMLTAFSEGFRQAKLLTTLAWWYMWLFLGSIVLSVAGVIPIVDIITGLVSWLASMGVWVIGLLLIYSYWHYLRDEPGAMHPLLAVVLLAIPVVNLFALFPAVHGAVKTLRNKMARLSTQAKPPSAGLSLWFCLLVVLPVVISLAVFGFFWLDFLNLNGWDDLGVLIMVFAITALVVVVCLLVAMILSIIMFLDMSRAMGAVLRADPSPVPPRYAPFAWVVGLYVGLIILSWVVFIWVAVQNPYMF